MMVSEARFRVRFAETDQMGIVHHAAYIVYFEEGRSEYSRQAGAPYSDLEALGFSLAVSEVSARYIVPARYDSLIGVRCWVAKLGSRGVTFEYEVVDAGTHEVLVTGFSRHICVGRDGNVHRLPASWLETLRRGAGMVS
jgi:acyl-CoA thioester hydrolase